MTKKQWYASVEEYNTLVQKLHGEDAYFLLPGEDVHLDMLQDKLLFHLPLLHYTIEEKDRQYFEEGPENIEFAYSPKHRAKLRKIHNLCDKIRQEQPLTFEEYKEMHFTNDIIPILIFLVIVAVLYGLAWLFIL